MGKLKNIFLRDWHGKVGALIEAIILWVIITASQSSNITFPGQIDVDFKNLKDGLAVISDSDAVQIKINLQNTNLNQITEDNFSASVDLSGLGVGTYVKTVDIISKNPNVKISSVSPSNLTVRIEKKLDKTVPVRARFDGSAADSYGASDTEITPSETTVSGPESIVKDVNEAVAPIHLSGESVDFSKTAQLFVYTASGDEIKNITLSPNEVDVQVGIVRVGDTKTVGIKVNLTGNLAVGYWISSISTDPEVVNIGGSASQIAATKYVATEPIDITNLNSTKTFSAKPDLPSGLTLETKTVSIKVTLNVERSDSVKEIAVAPNFTNLGGGLAVSSVSPVKTLVVLSGSPEILNQVGESNIDLSIDLSAYDVGTHNITLSKENLKFPSNLTFLSFNPSELSISIVRK
jgi:YbbR domain-containing protein